MKQPNFSNNDRGIALVVTLVILVLLAGLAVGLLQTSGLERGTSKSVAEKAKADLIAQTAANAAISRLVENLTNFPDSATSWDKVLQAKSASLEYEGTTLYYREQTPEATAAGTPSPMHMLPLISGAQTVQIWPLAAGATADDAKRNALPPMDNSNSYDLNRARFSGDKQGAIGTPTGAAARPEFRGQWINIKNSDDKLTGRYAYWMEDESFKANVNFMGNTLRGGSTVGSTPSDMPLQGLMKVALTSGDPDTVANDLFSFRAKFPNSRFFEYPALNQVNGQPTLADSLKFEGTIFSGGSNLSRSGSKRVNLNKVVVDQNPDPANPSAPTAAIAQKEIRKQLDQIIKTISYQLPNFSQRFYRNGSDKNALDVAGTGSVSDQTIYLNKIAANVRDYIDTDSQPTVVNNDLTINIGTAPTNAIPSGGASGTNEVIAIGKEAVPLIQEYMLRVKQIEPKLKASSTAPSQNYQIEIDHYVEFWNMTNRDITVANLGPNPFFRIANQFGWTSYGGTDIPVDPSRDFSVPLSSFKNANGQDLVFAAGTATVLTTDPANLPSTLQNVDPTRVFRPPAGTPADANRVYKGICKPKSPSTSFPHLDAQPRPGTATPSSSGDLETEIILGNANGVLESFGAPTVWYISVNADDGTQSRETVRVDQTQYHFRASSLKGNAVSSTISQTGDPRTNNEQLSLNSTSTVGSDQTSYATELSANSPPSATNNDASFTTLNSRYVDPTKWIDPATNTADAAHAPAVVANAALTSVGQLGNIFDAARSKGVSGSINYSRGGGRTLKIGQPDDLWDGDSNSASREWTAWRLADVFSTTDAVLDGRININGVKRDGGVALKAALYGYSFAPSPDSDPSLSGKGFDADPTDAADKINALVTQLGNRVTNQASFTQTVGPFAERGELSEMPIFNTGSDLASGVDTSKVYDRGREELFRRMAELITARGNTFSIYAVGQSLSPHAGAASPIVTSTAQLKVTFRIDPAWTTPPADPDWDPTISAQVTTRFSKPDKYAIKILYVGD